MQGTATWPRADLDASAECVALPPDLIQLPYSVICQILLENYVSGLEILEGLPDLVVSSFHVGRVLLEEYADAGATQFRVSACNCSFSV